MNRSRELFLLVLLLGLGHPAAAQSLEPLPAGDAREVTARVCSECHSVEVVTHSQRQDRDGWQLVVQEMIDRGARATDAEAASIVDYLATNFGVDPSGTVVVDNERVTVRDVTAPAGQPLSIGADLDLLAIDLKDGAVTFSPKGSPRPSLAGVHAIVAEFKDHPVQPLKNGSGVPEAFPRPGAKKVLENDRIVAWDYTWASDITVPAHFHDKDVVVVYLAEGALKSTTPDGTETINAHTYGFAKFNPRDRVHAETLVRGTARAIIVELK